MRLPQKTTFDTLQKTSECHEVPRLPRETKKCHIVKPPKVTPSAELTKGTAIWPSRGRLRTVADGCERLGNVERTHPQPPDPQSETGTFAMHSGKKTCKTQNLAISRHILSHLDVSRHTLSSVSHHQSSMKHLSLVDDFQLQNLLNTSLTKDIKHIEVSFPQSGLRKNHLAGLFHEKVGEFCVELVAALSVGLAVLAAVALADVKKILGAWKIRKRCRPALPWCPIDYHVRVGTSDNLRDHWCVRHLHLKANLFFLRICIFFDRLCQNNRNWSNIRWDFRVSQ